MQISGSTKRWGQLMLQRAFELQSWSWSKWLGRHELHSREKPLLLMKAMYFYFKMRNGHKILYSSLCLSCSKRYIWVNGRWKEMVTENSVDFKYQLSDLAWFFPLQYLEYPFCIRICKLLKLWIGLKKALNLRILSL